MAVRSTNQPPPLADYNLVAENRPLVEGLRREGAGWAEERMLELGAELGGAPLDWGRLVETMAVALQATLLDRHGDPAVAEAFRAREHFGAFGTLPDRLSLTSIAERHRPQP